MKRITMADVSTFRQRIRAAIRNPDIGGIEDDGGGLGSYRKCPLTLTIAGAQLRDAVVDLVRHPDIVSVKGHGLRLSADGECPLNSSVGSPYFVRQYRWLVPCSLCSCLHALPTFAPSNASPLGLEPDRRVKLCSRAHLFRGLLTLFSEAIRRARAL